MKRDLAAGLLLPFLTAERALQDAVFILKNGELADEERREWRLALGRVIADLREELVRPLYRLFPDLEEVPPAEA